MNKLPFIAAFVLFLAFEGFYFYSNKSYQNEKQAEQARTDAQAQAAPTEKPDSSVLQEQQVNDFHLVDGKDQKKELELWSTLAHKPMGTSEWKLENVKAKFFSEDSEYVVTGKMGQVDEVKKTMTIEGEVKLVSSNGYLFYTNELRYEPEKRFITTQDKVSLEGPQEKDGRLYLEGTGLNVSLVSNVMVMEDKVNGYKPMSDNRVMKISSQKAEFSGLKKSVAFKNNVVIHVDKMQVRGNFANFQYVNGRLDTLYMDGGIHLQDQDKTGSSGEAIVYFHEDKYIFRKKPFITQNENELIGDEVIVFNGGKRVQVKNAKIEYHQTENDGKK